MFTNQFFIWFLLDLSDPSCTSRCLGLSGLPGPPWHPLGPLWAFLGSPWDLLGPVYIDKLPINRKAAVMLFKWRASILWFRCSVMTHMRSCWGRVQFRSFRLIRQNVCNSHGHEAPKPSGILISASLCRLPQSWPRGVRSRTRTHHFWMKVMKIMQVPGSSILGNSPTRWELFREKWSTTNLILLTASTLLPFRHRPKHCPSKNIK